MIIIIMVVIIIIIDPLLLIIIINFKPPMYKAKITGVRGPATPENFLNIVSQIRIKP
jgi:hypothetical protein